MSDFKFTIVERDGPITIVTINGPELRNVLHPPSHVELEAMFDAFDADPDQSVAIITAVENASFALPEPRVGLTTLASGLRRLPRHRYGSRHGYGSRGQWNYPTMKALFASNDFVEGPRAISEKHPPRWQRSK